MLTDITQAAMMRALDATAMRNRAIANNIANVETPGYRRQDVSFEAELKQALEDPSLTPTPEEQVSDVAPQVVGDPSQPARENGNNVDIDKEMARLAENTIRYEALVKSLTMKSGMLRTAIDGRS